MQGLRNGEKKKGDWATLNELIHIHELYDEKNGKNKIRRWGKTSNIIVDVVKRD